MLSEERKPRFDTFARRILRGRTCEPAERLIPLGLVGLVSAFENRMFSPAVGACLTKLCRLLPYASSKMAKKACIGESTSAERGSMPHSV
jgi:hypothetical protein